MRNGEIEKVVVGIDGSPDAKKAVRWAQRYAECTGAAMTLVNARQWPSTYGVALVLEEWDPAIEARDTSEQARTALPLPDDPVHIAPAPGSPTHLLVGPSHDAD